MNNSLTRRAARNQLSGMLRLICGPKSFDAEVWAKQFRKWLRKYKDEDERQIFGKHISGIMLDIERKVKIARHTLESTLHKGLEDFE